MPPPLFPIFWFFLFSFLEYYEEFWDGPSILVEWVYNTPIFKTLSLYLEGYYLSLLMEFGDLIFFSIFG
jgi:hypothetical protein